MNGFTILLLTAAIVSDVAFGNKCPSEQETNWDIEKLLPHKDCDKFYKCTYGQPVEQNCPVGLQFNLKSLECDWDYNVDCGDRSVPGAESSPKSSEETKEIDAPEVSSESNEGSSGVESSEESNVTEKEDLVPAVPAPGEDSSSEKSIALLENGCPVDSSIPLLTPHEKRCDLFYYCEAGQKLLRKCSPNLHFNVELQICDWPSSAGCAKSVDKHNLLQYLIKQ